MQPIIRATNSTNTGLNSSLNIWELAFPAIRRPPTAVRPWPLKSTITIRNNIIQRRTSTCITITISNNIKMAFNIRNNNQRQRLERRSHP